jgi:hypothetical protein
MRAHPFLATLVASAAGVAVSLSGGVAHADSSAWMFVGGGLVSGKMYAEDMSSSGSMSFDIGVGTSPDGVVVLGGLFKIVPVFGSGTDFALTLRGATRGFQAGDFGLAIDAGGYARYWNGGSVGGTGAVVLGAPLGLQLSLQGLVGSNDALGFGAIAGIDFLRLTTQRQTLLDWWPNPSPAQQVPRDASSRRGAGFTF